MLNNVRNFIFENLGLGKKFIVGFSGGADSLALLHILKSLKDEGLVADILAIHFNHNLRGFESDGDEEFCKNFCKANNIRFESYSLNVDEFANSHGFHTEEAARKLRSSKLNEVLTKEGFDFIALGHHKGDLVETTLFNIFRGSGIAGLCSLRKLRGNIVRPLLDFSKEEILEYCQSKNLKFRTDSSNLSNDYSRNKIRNIIIPVIEKELERNIINPVYRLSSLAYEQESFIKREVLKLFNRDDLVSKDETSIIIVRNRLLEIDPFLQNELIKFIIRRYLGNLPSMLHMEKILDLETEFYKFQNLLIFKLDDRIIFKKDEIIETFLEFDKVYDLFLEKVKFSEGSDNGKFKVSKNSIRGKLRITKFTPDDVFHPYGKKGAVSVKRIMGEKKIASVLRDYIPVVRDDEKIVYIPSVGTDRRTAVKDGDDVVWVGNV
ncbi:MAG: tRNA lysidine(34) synthetase TilS [Candidatus Delongbacteria bacterium]|nr:tRNA lysidine(34) synthetase TilS [Candidatus Delongbacteria bacterium]MBN2836733.1 tRNA lysidine(34) synthetase TilS [Candidatus Delongbacteria bacterium]